ncbi:methylated-DNA--[protein]-cysteine S-methyltransferase [Thiohalophilus sp.]|uniref:methylated-DNA--[protein]-cysteine S-methyltransferase n=1 Tax=Thiohalophilus sp. TaxID=3028392 RepID=UPI002ACDEC4B|nr:methylated-DNA--[protein]-cysteine S-methyltransferase [Thiohalophilus sp.]MDZ7802574.1 methylated-DNA--[protein]-cysteine S-methyltransferase [Thiohalophilus sp.]
MKPSRFQIRIAPGALVVTLAGDCIIDIALQTRLQPGLPGASRASEKQIARELAAYFNDAAAPLVWPLDFDGSDFQKRVWQALRAIPVGRVRTYGELAGEVGGCAQAVGNACRQNPIPIYIPCHRVVAKTGLGGFAGQTAGPRIALKRWLLQHEGVTLPA